MTAKTQIAKCPKSSVPIATGYIGLVAFFILFAVFFLSDINIPLESQVFIFVFGLGSIMALYDFFVAKTYRAPESGIDFSLKFGLKKLFNREFGIKLVGLLLTLFVAFLYFWVADIYDTRFYLRLFDFVGRYALPIGIVILSYFSFVHVFMSEPRDTYWHLGAWLISLGQAGEGTQIRHHFLSLGVKIFFLPIMLGFFIDDWAFFKSFNYSFDLAAQDYFTFLYRFAYFIDLAFVSVGYLFALRLFNSHIRWTEQTIGGWLVCLICYAPFWQLIGRSYFGYGDGGTNWNLMEMSTPLYVVWAAVILVLSYLYSLSSVHFGIRFSNLTYRGLISHGTYRFTKHPAYVTKNITWWLMSVPFMAADWTTAIRNSIALLGVNAIYIARARYEEKCLSEAPEYKEYMKYISEKGIFRVFDWGRLKQKWNKRTKSLSKIVE